MLAVLTAESARADCKSPYASDHVLPPGFAAVLAVVPWPLALPAEGGGVPRTNILVVPASTLTGDSRVVQARNKLNQPRCMKFIFIIQIADKPGRPDGFPAAAKTSSRTRNRFSLRT